MEILVQLAELPAALTGTGEDRVRVGRHSVVVLDGASGTDSDVTVSQYVEYLVDRLVEITDNTPVVPLREALSAAIGCTAAALNLVPGRAPSSTVSIVRRGVDAVDVLVLGDSPVYVAHRRRIDRLADDRLARLDLPSRTELVERFAAGHGYDDRHQEINRQIRSEKATLMNRPDGYWIAEADPQAGAHAIAHSYPVHDVRWCAMLTDGVEAPASHLPILIEDLAVQDENGLRETLYRIHRWENDTDPEARHLPRFKRHDDKTIAVIRFP